MIRCMTNLTTHMYIHIHVILVCIEGTKRTTEAYAPVVSTMDFTGPTFPGAVELLTVVLVGRRKSYRTGLYLANGRGT